MAHSALFASLIVISAWISIPAGTVTFTMQTFAIFLTLGVLGGKWGCAAIGVYLLLGAAGLPVFSGFQGGIGVLLGPTGGFLWGFAAAGVVYWSFEKLCKPAGVIVGMLVCYACGCVWFSYYSGGAVGLAGAALTCILPYLIPDICKIWLAWHITPRLCRHLAA